MNGTKLQIAHKSTGDVETSKDQTLYEILKKLPSPKKQFCLSAAQKKWWYWFGKEFVSTKQISQLDLSHLQKAAFWMDARCQAYEKIQEKGYEGLVQKFKSGATNITGHLSVVEKADKHLDEVSSHFGLSIKDRKKLKTSVKAPSNQLDFLSALNMLDSKIAN